jgi:large subunit ribosomal protein L24
MPAAARALVEGEHGEAAHEAESQKNIKGGILTKEAPVHVSDLLVLDPDADRPSRTGRKILEDGRRVRVSKRSGAVLDR